MFRKFTLAGVVVFGLLVLASCGGIQESKETDRGRGDTGVTHINQGKMDLAVEMGDGFLNVGQKCIGPTAYITSTKGNGGAGGPVSPQFMDPLCLGVYRVDGSINSEQMARYIGYLAALQSGDAARAVELAQQLIAASPAELTGVDQMLR